MQRGISVLFVTHQFLFAPTYVVSQREDVLVVRVERRADGTRTFRLIEAGPLETSYGEDLSARFSKARTRCRERSSRSASATSTGRPVARSFCRISWSPMNEISTLPTRARPLGAPKAANAFNTRPAFSGEWRTQKLRSSVASG